MKKISELQINVLHIFLNKMSRQHDTISAVIGYESGLLGVRVSKIGPLGDKEDLFYSLKSIMDPINRLVTTQERSRVNAFRQ
jgi:hypothetical protein